MEWHSDPGMRMPRYRQPQNQSLPHRWRFKHGAYYYRVPDEDRSLWGGYQDYRLGETYEEALDQMGRVLAGEPVPDADQGHDEIVSAAIQIGREQTGVYFLIRNGEVVYVGQSISILQRLQSHGDKSWDSFSFIPCPRRLLTLLEARYIHRLKPEYNLRANAEP